MSLEAYQSLALRKRELNQALNMRELSAAYSIAYGKVRRMALELDFPISHGIVFPKYFERWMAKARRPRVCANPQQSAVGKVRGRGLKSGSLAALRRIGESLLSEGSSPALRGGSGMYV